MSMSLSVVVAEPIVLGEDASAVDASKYRKQYQTIFERAQIRQPRVAIENPQIGKNREFSWSDLLPIKTELLSPGIVKKDMNNKGKATTKPFCIIGYDKSSLDWIKQFQSTLVAERAVCFIVNVETENELEKIIDLLDGVPWQLLEANELAQKLEIEHYPVLVSRFGVEQ